MRSIAQGRRRGAGSRLYLLLLLWSLLHSAFTATALEFHLTPEGDDTARGTLAHPFATLERARRAVRERRVRTEPVTIWIEPGTFPVTSTFELTAEDSGTAESPITWIVAKPGETFFDAGRRISPQTFVRVSDDAVLARLPPEARGQVWQLDLRPLGLAHAERPPEQFEDGGGLFDLYCNGARQTLARWPNEGFITIARLIDNGQAGAGPTFVFRRNEPLRWTEALRRRQLWLAGYWGGPDDFRTVQVKAIDERKSSLTLSRPWPLGIDLSTAGPEGAGAAPWRAWNLVEAIDQPGEWAIDFQEGRLYWWPPGPLAGADIALADFAEPLLRLNGAAHVTWRGLIFQHGLGDGVEISGGVACTLAACTVRRMGGRGVVVLGGTGHSILACDLDTLGHGGLLLSGGDRATLTPAGHLADNNHIWNYGLAKPVYSPGIGVGFPGLPDAVGCLVTHNRVHGSPHAAILYGGNDNRFEWNEVYDFARETSGIGGFHTTYDWTSYGNVVRSNFIHHAPTGVGVYLDAGDSGDLVEENLCYGLRTGVASGGGHDNVLRNNVAIACRNGAYIDSRGATPAARPELKLKEGLTKVSPLQPPWSEHYPRLAGLLLAHELMTLPHGCVLERNVAIECARALLVNGEPDDFAAVTLRDNVAKPAAAMGFADPATLDFRMPDATAPVFQEVPGFEPLAFGDIGLFTSELRPQVEPREARFSTGKLSEPTAPPPEPVEEAK